MIRFEMSELRFEGTDSEDRFDLLLGVCADLALQTEGRLLYSEADFPVTELAVQLNAWKAGGLESGEDFEFDSMESDESGLVWFRRSGTGYRVGSLFQEFPAMDVHTPAAVRSTVERFVTDLLDRTRRELDINLDRVLST